MAQNDFINRVKRWDNHASQWLSRHFYIFLFEIILAIIFLLAFLNTLRTLNASLNIQKNNALHQLAITQSINSTLIVMLLILIALGILNIINNNTRIRNILKNIEFNLSRRRSDTKADK